METLETLSNEKATMEIQLVTQQRLIVSMREDLAESKERRAMAEGQAESRHSQIADFKVQFLGSTTQVFFCSRC